MKWHKQEGAQNKRETSANQTRNNTEYITGKKRKWNNMKQHNTNRNSNKDGTNVKKGNQQKQRIETTDQNTKEKGATKERRRHTTETDMKQLRNQKGIRQWKEHKLIERNKTKPQRQTVNNT